MLPEGMCEYTFRLGIEARSDIAQACAITRAGPSKFLRDGARIMQGDSTLLRTQCLRAVRLGIEQRSDVCLVNKPRAAALAIFE